MAGDAVSRFHGSRHDGKQEGGNKRTQEHGQDRMVDRTPTITSMGVHQRLALCRPEAIFPRGTRIQGAEKVAFATISPATILVQQGLRGGTAQEAGFFFARC